MTPDKHEANGIFINNTPINNLFTMKGIDTVKTCLFALAALLCVVALAPSGAFAAGTPAGTVITNTATMNYKDLAGNASRLAGSG